MHRHNHEHLEGEAPDAVRDRVEAPDQRIARAAATGRTDVLGPTGILGLQRTAGNAAAAGALEEDGSSVHDVINGGGEPLHDDVRSDMEARMGQDFSDVRVHTDDAADRSARSVSAHAYTAGSHIVFQRGAYDPGSSGGKTTIAHELTHVVQQRNGPVDGTPVGGGVSVSDPSDRFEREASANAEAVMSAPAPAQRQATEGAGAMVQREEAEEEDEVQASHDDSLGPIQREAAEEEEDEVQA